VTLNGCGLVCQILMCLALEINTGRLFQGALKEKGLFLLALGPLNQVIDA